MTLEELRLIEKALVFDDNKECAAALLIIRRDIKLKTMNPVTGKIEEKLNEPNRK